MSSSFDQLLDALGQPSPVLPKVDLNFLSDLDGAQVERLRKLWTRLDPIRRREIMGELGRLAQEHFELNFERVDRMALSDPDSEVRRLAIDNLWESEDPGLVPALDRALTADSEPSVRAAAAAALGAFVYLGEVDRLPAEDLAEVERALLHAVQDEDEIVRLRSLESLGYSSRPEVPSLIGDAYRSSDESRRRSSLLAMARSADDAWKTEVLAELRSPSPVLRLEATKAAGELELQESIQELIDLVEDGDQGIHRAAIWSLGQVGGKRPGEFLSRLLEATEDGDEAGLIEDALDQLAFVEGTRDLTLLDVDEDDEETAYEDEIESEDEIETEDEEPS
jgi:HEAT repeat protein